MKYYMVFGQPKMVSIINQMQIKYICEGLCCDRGSLMKYLTIVRSSF